MYVSALCVMPRILLLSSLPCSCLLFPLPSPTADLEDSGDILLQEDEAVDVGRGGEHLSTRDTVRARKHDGHRCHREDGSSVHHFRSRLRERERGRDENRAKLSVVCVVAVVGTSERARECH